MQIGDKLPNHAKVLRAHKFQDNRFLVLCDTAHGEFVTWMADEEHNCFWGHYFQTDLDAASKDYQLRLTERRHLKPEAI